MADFHVVTHVPQESAHPGGCFLCKCDQRQSPRDGSLEPMIDTHVSVDFTSSAEDLDAILHLRDNTGRALVFCQSCVEEMGSMFGMLTDRQVEALYAEKEAMTAAYYEQETKLSASQEANRVLLHAVNGAFGEAPVERRPPPVRPEPEMFADA